MAEAKLQRLNKTYGRRRVLTDLDLKVDSGECFTLLGPSGCGKTVILRLIAGFETPDSGEISIGGRLVASPAQGVNVPTEERRVSVVFQDYAVWPHKTVMENVVYPLAIQKRPAAEIQERAKRAIAQVSLAGLENRLPSQLSGGQQQRVALARALVADPELMLLDEPLSNLDANLREEMRFEIKQIQRSTGVSILYVTHDQEIALALSDRLAIMDVAGRVRQIGPPAEIFERPADGFVFKFLGVSNFIPLERHEGRLVLKGQGDVFPAGPASPAGEMSAPVAACRPSDIELLPAGEGLSAAIRRRNFLGSMIDYRVGLGGLELRVQQPTREALESNRLFAEGDACGLKFHALQWFEAGSLEEAAS